MIKETKRVLFGISIAMLSYTYIKTEGILSFALIVFSVIFMIVGSTGWNEK